MASLGKDLAYIRKEKNISLDDIYEVTKIPKRILHSIEDDSIFSDFEENPTYIRSYIRSYAKALSIDEKEIVYALNKKEKNDYSGSLQKLLKNPPPKPMEDKDEAQDDSEQDTVDEKPEAEPEKEEEPDLPEEPTGAKNDKKPDVRSVDWADMGRQFQPLKTARSRTWVGIITVLILLIGGGAVYYFYYSESDALQTENQDTPTQQESSQPVSTDSLQLNVVSPEETDTSQTIADTGADFQNEALQQLPDTLNIVLYAAYGKLEPVRVYTDIMDNINPYWIEQGQALRFNFVNDIQIRGQYSRMVLLLNGHLIQNFREEFYNPETRLIEINRSYFEGDSQWLQPAPDSLAIDAPPPTVIQERPTFN